MKHVNGAEHGGSTSGKLGRLLAYHEERAAAFRLVIAEMNGAQTAAKKNGHDAVLAAALALDGARVKAKPAKKKKKTPNVLAQREATARTLKIIEAAGALSGEKVAQSGVKPGWLGPMVQRGYLTRTASGEYKRTKKAFEVRPTHT